MSLSGDLGFVPLAEVLRLLIRADRSGEVEVRGGVTGRVFVVEGGVGLATTTDDDGLRTMLVNSGLVDRAPREGGEADGERVDFLAEVTTESLYRLANGGETFEVYEGRESPYSSPRPFELEELLEKSKRRGDEWAEVRRVVPDLDSQVLFKRDLGDRDEVTIGRDAWRVLTEVGPGASVRRVAEELGMTDFWAARVMAGLIEDGLLRTEVGTPLPYAPTGAGPLEAPALEPEPEGFPPEPETAKAEAPAPGEAAPVTDDEGDWAPDEPERSEQAGAWWLEEADAGADEELPEDTEAFLQKVFSELGSADSDEEETEPEEGYGLLRRRRLAPRHDPEADV